MCVYVCMFVCIYYTIRYIIHYSRFVDLLSDQKLIFR